jgi:hypothetical protein
LNDSKLALPFLFHPAEVAISIPEAIEGRPAEALCARVNRAAGVLEMAVELLR